MVTLKINEQGQITLPPEILSQLGLFPGAKVQVQVIDNMLQISQPTPPSRGIQLIATLRGKAKGNLSTDEILRLTRGEQ